MATGTGWNLSCWHAFVKYALTLRDKCEVAGDARRGWLRAKIIGKTKNHEVAELRCHAPHVSLRVGIGARLVLERVQLQFDVLSRLRGQVRKGRRDTTAVDAVTSAIPAKVLQPLPVYARARS